MRRAWASAAVVAVVAAACSAGPSEVAPTASPAPSTARSAPDPGSSATPSPTPTGRAYAPLPDDLVLAWEPVADGFAQLAHLASPPGDPRLFVVEKDGRIWIVEDGQRRPDPFLDIRGSVRTSGTRAEQGMFALAFHPDYATNGRFFVHYSARPDGDTAIEEYHVSRDDPDRADPEPVATVLAVDQPFRWHNGGLIAFGPDGMLWIGLGDGGPDHRQNAQDTSNVLGALLRIDVDRSSSGDGPYAIPPDNPYADGADGAPEIWAYGLRNPWRFAFDPVEGLLYIADVGQYVYEEIDVAPMDEPGLNYGWPVREGRHCFPADEEDCPSEGFIEPAVEYAHVDECAVVGGVVYDGDAIPDLVGHYLYSDFCGGWLRSFRYRDGEVADEREWDTVQLPLPTSFGLDADGEVLVVTSDGQVLRLVKAG